MIVIPMAGSSNRFRVAGYETPKYMLDLNGASVFYHSIKSFSHYFDRESFLFIARNVSDTKAFLIKEIEALGIKDYQIVVLDKPTSGQAETVRLGLAKCNLKYLHGMLIFNIDTFRPNFRMPVDEWMSKAHGYLEVMHSNDPGFSYIMPGEMAGDSRVVKTIEKVVISDLASTGIYWFRHRDHFFECMDDFDRNSTGGTESYIAPLYNFLIKRGLDIRFKIVPQNEVIFCGIPSQYESLIAKSTEKD